MGVQSLHVAAALQIELVRLDLQPVFIFNRLSRADADQDVLNLGIALGQIMHIVGRYQRNAGLAA